MSGTVLKGKWRLENKIGEGGMGVVYRATDLDALEFKPDNAVVAIKVLKPDLHGEGAQAALFEEVELTKTMHTDHVISVYSFERDAHNAFMVMEHLVGRPLDRLIDKDYALGMPFAAAWPIIDGMGRGLSYAHKRGLIHSDFKPSNVFVTPGTTKVLDFGIARAAGQPLMGLTVAYASCEMIEGKPADRRDDVYGFGVVVYQLLTGKHPFCDERGENSEDMWATNARARKRVPAAIPGLNRRQNAAILGALRFERAERTATVQEVLDGLSAGSAPRPIFLYALVGSLLIGMAAILNVKLRAPGVHDSDQKFLSRLLARRPTVPANSDPETVRQLLELGHDFLQEGLHPFDPGVLSENAGPLSSAMAIYEKVLQADPGNSAAAKGILAVAHAYKSEAQRLYASGELNRADELTRIGLRLWPDSAELSELDTKIKNELPARPQPR